MKLKIVTVKEYEGQLVMGGGWRNDRTGLRKFLQEYWTKPYEIARRFGTQLVELTAERTICPSPYKHERRDIGVLQGRVKDQFAFNIFIELDRSHGGSNGGEGMVRESLTHDDGVTINIAVADWMEQNAEFVALQRKWYFEKPWERIMDMYVEDAILTLGMMGW